MSLHVAVRQTTSAERTRGDLLARFLQAYWLRPENALWMTLRSRALSLAELDQPSLDVSCGDGVFSFLHCDGVLDPDFDVFWSAFVDAAAKPTDRDMFDNISHDYHPAIVSPPTRTIDVGTDAKRTMLAKADRLNFYDWLIQHDNNEPLPFPDDAFQTVYCNAAYWVDRIDPFLSELKRITRPGGCAVLQVKLSSLSTYTLAEHRHVLGQRLLDILDRGRAACWPSLADRSTWERRFTQAGFSIESATPFVTKTHAHLWDIGLRPIAPLLVRMTQALSVVTRAGIKRDWVDLFCEILDPLCNPDLNLSGSESEPAEIQYVLTPA